MRFDKPPGTDDKENPRAEFCKASDQNNHWELYVFDIQPVDPIIDIATYERFVEMRTSKKLIRLVVSNMITFLGAYCIVHVAISGVQELRRPERIGRVFWLNGKL